MMKVSKKMGAGLSAAALALALTACGSEDATSGSGGAEDDAQGGMGTITLGYVPAWTDGLSTAWLLENQLREIGYDVEMESVGEAALVYQAATTGDVSIYTSAWPEVTHASYMEKYGDDLEDLGTFYDNARLTWAVPTYMDDVNSIEDLKGMADTFESQVIGIEPSAGLTDVSLNSVFPEYGLGDEYQLLTSSTTAMLAQLKKATDAEEPIVVTFWSPFWANSRFPVKELEDPKGALGEGEGMHFLGTKGFTEEFPEAAGWIGELELNDDEYGALEDMVVNQFEEGEEAEAVSAWIEKYPDVLPEIH